MQQRSKAITSLLFPSLNPHHWSSLFSCAIKIIWIEPLQGVRKVLQSPITHLTHPRHDTHESFIIKNMHAFQ